MPRPARKTLPKPDTFLGNFVALKYLPRFFGKVYQASPPMLIGNLLLRFLQAVIPVAMLWVGKEIIDEVVRLIELTDPELTRLYKLIGFELGLAILNDLLGRGVGLTDGLLGQLYSNDSSVELIQKTSRVEIADLENAEFYDKLERARRQTTSRVSLMSNVLAQGQDLVTIVSLVSALLYFYPILMVLVALSVLPSFFNELKFSRSTYQLARQWTPERRELDYMRLLGASDVTAKEVKLFGLADYICNTFRKLSDKYYEAQKKLLIKRTLLGGLFSLLSEIAYYGAYVFIILKTVAGAVTLGELTFLSGSFNRLRQRLTQFFSRITRINESALYLADYFDFIDMDFDRDTGFERYELPSEIKTGFEFRDVSFRYSGGAEDVLRGVSFKLHKGERIALVGQNGSGKSTIVKMLLRFYEPTSGAILLDGIDVRHYDKETYQQLFSAIFQDFVKYYLPAKVNIGVGSIDQLDNQELIEQAAERSLAKEVIDSLPAGYEQNLGRRFKDGVELSGGQWQKIAIARAYMSQAPVVILDEPTSALDARAEYEVFQRFLGLTEDRTSIIISHRFSTVRMADRILVIENGVISERGTHEELMASDGLYAELFSLQAEGYQ